MPAVTPVPLLRVKVVLSTMVAMVALTGIVELRMVCPTLSPAVLLAITVAEEAVVVRVGMRPPSLRVETLRTPPLRVVMPAYRFEPERIQVPAPDLVTARVLVELVALGMTPAISPVPVLEPWSTMVLGPRVSVMAMLLVKVRRPVPD